MKLGFHGATTMTADLRTDVAASAHAGFQTEDTSKEGYTDAARLLPGLGVVPLDEICARLKGIGYDGPCSIELFRPEYWERDPMQLAVKARDAAIKVLSPYFAIEE